MREFKAAEAELLEAKEASEAANRELRQLIAAAEEEVLAETNLARLRSHLQGKLSATDVATAALSTIVETLKAPSGALYILEEDGSLQRRAAHALPMEAESTTSFPAGSGSIGRAARSREMSTFDPGDQSWSVTFGIGQVAPRQVVTCPLLAGDTVAGVVRALPAIRDDRVPIAMAYRGVGNYRWNTAFCAGQSGETADT